MPPTATQTAADAGRTLLLDLRPSQLTAHPRNPRRVVGDVTELAASIADAGILEPLLVVPAKPGKVGGPRDRYVVLAGHRRLAAAEHADLATVPTIVRTDLAGDDARQLAAMLIENVQRADLSPVEEAEGYQGLLDLGYTVAKVAAVTGRARATVRARIALAKLDTPTREKIHTGQITLDQAAEIARRATTPEAARKLEKAAGTDHWDRTLVQVQDQETAARVLAKAAAQAAVDHPDTPILTDLPSGWEWREAPEHPRALADLDLDPATHATSCPGHAIAVDAVRNWSGRSKWRAQITPVCTTPDAHADTETTHDPAAAAHAAALAAANAREEQITEGLAAAAVARRAHLADCLAHGAGAHAAALAAAQARLKPSRLPADGRRYAADLLGLDVDKPTAEILTEALDDLDLACLVVFADLVDNWGPEKDLLRPQAWRSATWTADYRARLEDTYGWSLTPEEQAAADYVPDDLDGITEIEVPDTDAEDGNVTPDDVEDEQL